MHVYVAGNHKMDLISHYCSDKVGKGTSGPMCPCFLALNSLTKQALASS